MQTFSQTTGLEGRRAQMRKTNLVSLYSNDDTKDDRSTIWRFVSVVEPASGCWSDDNQFIFIAGRHRQRDDVIAMPIDRSFAVICATETFPLRLTPNKAVAAVLIR